MPSVFMLRALLGASLGLGTLDLVWINAVLAPQLVPGANPVASALATTASPAAEVVAPVTPAPGEPRSEPRSEDVADTTRRVYFATRSATLDEPARAELARLVAEAGPRAELELEGHADYRGGEAFNLSLSRARALAVRAELVKLGMSPSRIHVGFAGEQPSTGGELWRDRRVDLQLRGAR